MSKHEGHRSLKERIEKAKFEELLALDHSTTKKGTTSKPFTKLGSLLRDQPSGSPAPQAKGSASTTHPGDSISTQRAKNLALQAFKDRERSHKKRKARWGALPAPYQRKGR